MTVYWLMYLIPAGLVLSPIQGTHSLRHLSWTLVILCYVLLVGLRYEVGADWYAYVHHYELTDNVTWSEAITTSDPAYAAINWFAALLNAQIYSVNIVCAAIFFGGVTVFCRREPLPWLAMAIAVPYLVIVVAMGYTRQGAAIGCFFLALIALREANLRDYLLFVAIAALFHKSAIVMWPLGIFLLGRGNILKALSICGMGLGFGFLLVQDSFESTFNTYVERQLQSEGTAIRLAMNTAATLTLLVTWKWWKNRFPDSDIWRWIALLSMASLGLLAFNATTAVDRFALYLLPLQLVVFSRIPLFAENPAMRAWAATGVLFGYGAVLWVWLNLATHAIAWVPYRNVLFL